MASGMWDIFSVSVYRRMASIGTVGLCVLCQFPQSGYCFSVERAAQRNPGPTGPGQASSLFIRGKELGHPLYRSGESPSSQEGVLQNAKNVVGEILNPERNSGENSLLNKIDALGQTINESEAPILESLKFLQSFIDQTNSKYGLALTVAEVCRNAKENIRLLQISPQAQEVFLMALDLLENSSQSFELTHLSSLKIYWPWEWKWFGWNKKSENKERRHQRSGESHSNAVEVELPGNCIFGAAEVAVGLLVLLLPVPGSQLVGLGLIGDGGRRIADGVIQLSDERRADPNYVCPQPPF